MLGSFAIATFETGSGRPGSPIGQRCLGDIYWVNLKKVQQFVIELTPVLVAETTSLKYSRARRAVILHQGQVAMTVRINRRTHTGLSAGESVELTR